MYFILEGDNLMAIKKRGQAMAAATLIAIIAGLIVLYLLFLPPAEREQILGGTGSEGASGQGHEGAETILFELPGPKSFIPEKEKTFEKYLPNVNLLIFEEGTVLKNANSLFASKSLFSESIGKIDFEITDPQNTKNIILNFIVKEGKGRLLIKLNGNEIFNQEIKQANINPIELKDYTKEGLNTLEFYASSPGLMFWGTNSYTLEDLSVTANLVKREAQESTLKFFVTSPEKENLDKLTLRLVPTCTVGSVGKLDVWMNNYNLYSGIPDCGAPVMPIEFSAKILVSGENSLQFKTTKGKYLIEQIKITGDYKTTELPVYYFQLTQDQYDHVKNETANVTLTMRFVDDVELKEADIRVNGMLTGINQKDINYTRDISKFIDEGNNALKIEPIETLDVVELKVIYND
jgi:hypothetical protein